MGRPLLVIEDLEKVRRLPVGSFWGVKLSVTPIAWWSPIIFFIWGLALALARTVPPGEKLIAALFFMIAVELATLLHAFGHILSGKIVGSPMDELLLTATRDINLYYGDQRGYSSAVHLGRSLGGPLVNLVVAIVLYALLLLIPPGLLHALVEQVAGMNLFFGAGSFLPIPSVDGEVIWREVIKILRARLRAA